MDMKGLDEYLENKGHNKYYSSLPSLDPFLAKKVHHRDSIIWIP